MDRWNADGLRVDVEAALLHFTAQERRIAQLEAALGNLLLKVGDPVRVKFYPMDDTGVVDCLFCGGEEDGMNGTFLHDLDCAYFAAKALLA